MRLEKYIDHTMLKPDAKKEDIIKICKEAIEYGFASVCVNPYYTSLVRDNLKETQVKTCIVVGFPLGASTKEVKAFEAEQAIANGAQEVDMVINIGALKDKKYDVVKQDIEYVVEKARGKALVKVIIETCLLTLDEIKDACQIAKEAGADFVKTSTGFSKGGAKKEDVKLMKSVVGNKIKVKASGGIRNKKDAIDMIEAGADRIGASSSIKIIKE